MAEYAMPQSLSGSAVMSVRCTRTYSHNHTEIIAKDSQEREKF